MKRVGRLGRLVVTGWLLFAAAGAAAKPCGDDVGGRDVPCACGDTVAGSTVLTDDPVTTDRCPNNGLIVAAPRTAEVVEVDLNGRSLRGSGKGSGIWIMSGGKNGARIVSHSAPAVIDGFRDGVIARIPGTVSVIDNVIASHNRRDGIQIFSNDVQIRGTEARDSGRDGVAVRGKRWLLKDVRAVNSRRFGIKVTGSAGTLGVQRGGVVAEHSGRIGINVMGSGHRVNDCVAIGGGGDGIETAGDRHEIIGCLALDNAGTGVDGTASLGGLQGNRAERNGVQGIFVRGHNVIDGGGNVGFDNGVLLDSQAVKECEIDGAICR